MVEIVGKREREKEKEKVESSVERVEEKIGKEQNES